MNQKLCKLVQKAAHHTVSVIVSADDRSRLIDCHVLHLLGENQILCENQIFVNSIFTLMLRIRDSKFCANVRQQSLSRSQEGCIRFLESEKIFRQKNYQYSCISQKVRTFQFFEKNFTNNLACISQKVRTFQFFEKKFTNNLAFLLEQLLDSEMRKDQSPLELQPQDPDYLYLYFQKILLQTKTKTKTEKDSTCAKIFEKQAL